MSKFYKYFPVTPYDINKNDYSNYQLATNIFTRIGVVKESLENISGYYVYDVVDGDTPEILAEKIYGSSEAHWIILLANERLNGFYDWPLNYDQFNKYIVNKYRAAAGGNTLTDIQIIAWAQQSANLTSNNIYKFEKVIERTEQPSNVTTTWRYQVNYDKESLTVPTNVPFDYYLNLSTTGTYSTYSVDNTTVQERVYGTFQTVWDHEVEENDKKRTIKIIKKEYYSQIMNELRSLVNPSDPMKRKLI